MTNAGSRTDSLTKFRIRETDRFEPINTSSVARPRPMALTTVLVTASNGHSPRTCTRAGLLCQRPSLIISLDVFVLMIRNAPLDECRRQWLPETDGAYRVPGARSPAPG